MSAPDLLALYQATQQDFRFGIGVHHGPGACIRPILQLHYAAWPVEVLKLIVESIRGGVALTWIAAEHGRFDLHLATRETTVIQAHTDAGAHVLRAPAWDAHLPGIEPAIRDGFQTRWRELGEFILLVTTPEAQCELRIPWPQENTGPAPPVPGSGATPRG